MFCSLLEVYSHYAAIFNEYAAFADAVAGYFWVRGGAKVRIGGKSHSKFFHADLVERFHLI